MSIYHLYKQWEWDQAQQQAADEYEEWVAQIMGDVYEIDEEEIERLLGLNEKDQKEDEDKEPICYCNRHDFTHEPYCEYYKWSQKRKEKLWTPGR